MKTPDRPPMKNAASVATLLKEIFRHRGYDSKIEEHRAFVLWDKIVGEQIATRTRPVRIRDGVMHVQVDHTVWMQQLQLLKPKILEKLRRAVPGTEIRDLFFRVSASAHSKQRIPSKEKVPQRRNYLTEDDLNSIRSTTGSIEDSETRMALTSLLIKQKNLIKAENEQVDE